MSEQVLVTGAYGFVAAHCILQLLEQGYLVRGTLRMLDQAQAVRQMITQAGGPGDRLELVQADLLDDRGWEQAVRGCMYVLHVASPALNLPASQAESLIRPARDGTLRVLKAAAAAGVRRVVLTSSLAAVVEGYDDYHRSFDEKNWTQLDHKPRAYAFSKTLAERAAWDFVKNLGPGAAMDLAVINPGNIHGPMLVPRHAKSNELIVRLMRRVYPGCARLSFPVVDVRDVAGAHLLAMTTPSASGQRFCCLSSSPWMVEMAAILNEHFTSRGYRVSERVLPDLLVRLITMFDLDASYMQKSLGKRLQVSNRFIVEQLGWKPRSLETVIVDTAESLIRFKIV